MIWQQNTFEKRVQTITAQEKYITSLETQIIIVDISENSVHLTKYFY